MATKRKTTRKQAKARVTKSGSAKAKPARAARGEREVNYTDLRKVMLANALKRLR